MTLVDDLDRLQKLRESGAIDDQEFSAAKAKLLNAPPPPSGIRLDFSAGDLETRTRQWAMLLHLSTFSGYLVPLAGLVVPIVIWQMKKEELPGLDEHGKNVANWISSFVIYFVIGFVLTFVIVGVPILIGLSLLAILFPIVGAIKANGGEAWRYPLSIRFID